MLPFDEALQHEGMNFCLLCLIDISILAIHVIGSLIWDSTLLVIWLNLVRVISVNVPYPAGLILRNQQF